MTEQHECEWGPAGYDEKGNRHDYDVCQICQRVLLPTERYQLLNEYETLKAENKALRDEIASDNDELLGCVIEEQKLKDALAAAQIFAIELKAELETLKKATDEMRECLGFFASVIKSGEPWTETCEKAIADILEGKK